MVCTRAHHAHRNNVPTPPPAGRAGTQNRSLARDLARWLGQAARLLRGHGCSIEEVNGCDPRGNTAKGISRVATTNPTPPGVKPGGRGLIGGKSGLDRVGSLGRLFGGHDLQSHFLLQRAAKEAADAVGLPLSRGDELLEGGTAGSL